LLARNERKQRPIGAPDQEKTDRAHHRGLEMPIVPGVANSGHDGVADAFGRQAPMTLRRTPPPQSTHHTKIADGVEP
jgi:hypothetical protein